MKLYYVTAYTGQWAHRRLMFANKQAAWNYAKKEQESDDVREVWMTVYDTSRPAEVEGSIHMEVNCPIDYLTIDEL